MLSCVGGGILSTDRKFKSKNRWTEKENLVYLSLCCSLRVVLLHHNKKITQCSGRKQKRNSEDYTVIVQCTYIQTQVKINSSCNMQCITCRVVEL
jgi:hypothetical protein